MDIKLIMEGEEWDNVVCACAKNKIKNTHSLFKKLKCVPFICFEKYITHVSYFFNPLSYNHQSSKIFSSICIIIFHQKI